MNILIRGMEMPQNCAECKMWSICDCLKEFEDYESLLYAVDDGDWVRADECPLIELPPHGRLIDADATCNDLATVDPRYETMIDWCIRVIEAQPTVIEGSET